MPSNVPFGRFTLFDLFAFFPSCITFSDPTAVTTALPAAREPPAPSAAAAPSLPTRPPFPRLSPSRLTTGALHTESGSDRRLLSTPFNASRCLLPRPCAEKFLTDIVLEQSVQTHCAPAVPLPVGPLAGSGTVWSTGDSKGAG